MTARLVMACLLLGLTAPAASGEPVAIVNAGFEDLYLGSNLPAQYGGDVPAGAFPVGPAPSGWTPWHEGGSAGPGEFIGVLNPGTAADHAPNPAYFPAGAPEGDNAVLLYTDGDVGGLEYGVEQTLATDVAPNTRYTLTVQVGNIASGTALVEPFLSFGYYDLRGFPGYRIQLLAGGQVIAEDTETVAPGEGIFELATAYGVTGPSPPSGPLVVRVVNRNQPDVAGVRGIEVDFDDVVLDATPVAQTPVAPLAGWGLVFLLLPLGRRLARAS